MSYLAADRFTDGIGCGRLLVRLRSVEELPLLL